MKTSILLIISLLVIFILILSTVRLEGQTLWQAANGIQVTPSPTPTPQGGRPPLHRQSGDTQGLKIGAAVIVLIVLGGLMAQSSLPPRDRP